MTTLFLRCAIWLCEGDTAELAWL